MKKHIYDLSFDDMRTLIQNNESLREELRNDAIDTAQSWVEDYLTGCPADYQIGSCCQGEHFSIDVDRLDLFGKWFDDVQYTYCLFNDRDSRLISEYIETENESLLEGVNNTIYKRLMSEYDSVYDIDVLTDICMSCLEKYFDEDCYTDENFSNVYQYIPTQVIQAHVDTVY